MRLSDVARGKDNNFNLIRIIAALAVLVSHCFALFRQPEPLVHFLGMSMGSIAVDIFFVASGFLVAGSLFVRQSISEYVLARVLRIYPALIVMLLLTVCLLGTFFTSLSLSSYFADARVYSYLMRCLTLISGIAYYLPGVFENNPYKGAVNGSLWTLLYEVCMYLIFGVLWLAFRLTKKNKLTTLGKLAVWLLMAGFVFALKDFYILNNREFIHLFYLFFTGVAYSLLMDRITLSPRVFFSCVFAMLATSLISQQVFFYTYYLFIAYALFYLAYVPAGAIRQYNALGDYSYGVYIYAFPVQQAVVALFPGFSVAAMMAVSAGVTLILAILSWHLIEKRALRLKEFFLQRSRRELVEGASLSVK